MPSKPQTVWKFKKRRTRSAYPESFSSALFAPVVGQNACPHHNCAHGKKESSAESCQPGPSRPSGSVHSVASAPEPPAGKGTKRSVSEFCAPANSNDMVDDLSGASTTTPELKLSMGDCPSGSEKSVPVPVHSPKPLPVPEQHGKAFLDITLGHHRYSLELIKKIGETTETIGQMKIKILRSFRKLVVLSKNFSDEFKGFDEKEFPVLKEDVSAEDAATVKKAVKKFFELLHKYKKASVHYTELSKAAEDAQRNFSREWLQVVQNGEGEGCEGLSVKAYRDLLRNNAEAARKYETHVLFGGEEEVRDKVNNALIGFGQLIEQHQKEAILAENFYEAITKMLKGNPKELNVGRVMEKQLYEMQKKFMAQSLGMDISEDCSQLVEKTGLELDQLTVGQKSEKMARETERKESGKND